MPILFPAIGGALLSLLMGNGSAQLAVLEVSPEVRNLVSSYRQLIDRYRRGEADSVDAVIAIPTDHLDSILEVIFGLPDMPWARTGELRGAAMLHTDAALRVAGPDDEDGPRRRHLTVAGRMVHASGAPGDPFVPRWYLAVSRALREQRLFAVAQDLLEAGRARAPGNPTVLYESATLAETLARGYSVSLRENISGPASIEPDTARNLQRRAGFLNDAAGWLREAVERDASLLPRLHLGRVETLRGKEKDALGHLDRVAGSATTPSVMYLAALFSGAAHERLRRIDAAETSYRQAIERYPAGQAAYIALSELLQRTGRLVEARAALHTMLETKPGHAGEPLWWYLADPPEATEERLAELRREVRP
jgi:tetratricopeptide (TPR) repeat protein